MNMLSMRTFNCKDEITLDKISNINDALQKFGAVHIINSGLRSINHLDEFRNNLGFTDDALFIKGGRTSKFKQEKWVNHFLRRMDHYPKELYLIANNEVQYQRSFPRYVMFFCNMPPSIGGRTFLHSALNVQKSLEDNGKVGKLLLSKLKEQNLTYITGYLCKYCDVKENNYFMSWQEKYNTNSIETAIKLSQQNLLEADKTWIVEENHSCRFHVNEKCVTLMTKISLPAFVYDPQTNRHYLRFPRIAMTPPTIINGYREYLFEDGTSLSKHEEEILKSVYLDTREGLDWSQGDIVLFDNIRYGHSREPYQGEREVYVSMAYEMIIDGSVIKSLHHDNFYKNEEIYPKVITENIVTPSQARYVMPSFEQQIKQEFSSRIVDAKGNLSESDLLDIKNLFQHHGFLHIINTGLNFSSPSNIPDHIIEMLGFGLERQFPWGGLSSGRTQRKSYSRYMNAVDIYPNNMYLLPHNEILYQHYMPNKLMFFYANDVCNSIGGRTFSHSADALLTMLSSSDIGKSLILKLEKYGFLIETGFLDQKHPYKDQNYFRSWQERFNTNHINDALSKCKSSKLQFDECWLKEEKLNDDKNNYYTLMTRITVPAFKTHDLDKKKYLLFPRIAFDGPMLHNGYRRFLIGNGEELSIAEKELLLKIYWNTREGMRPKSGDIILIDNIRYGHSREPFKGSRTVGVTMADISFSDTVTNEHKNEIQLMAAIT